MRFKLGVIAAFAAGVIAAAPASARDHHGNGTHWRGGTDWHDGGHGGAGWRGERWHSGWHGRRHGSFHGWHGGHWKHGWHDGRFGWWWIVGPSWFFYSAPIHPYPPARTVIVERGYPGPADYSPHTGPYGADYVPNGPPPEQNWYYCDSPKGYYPYVQNCSAQWRAVPAKPAK